MAKQATVAKAKTISKTKLNAAIKKLPKPVQAHLRRCRSLATYFMERVATEDWFLESKMTADNIISAIGYHDIGKCFIPKEAMYKEHCTTAAARKAYASHASEGLAFVERECNVTLSDYRATSFGGLLQSVLLYHHRYADGSGFPDAPDMPTELPFVAKLCTVIDTFDNLLFVGNAGEPDINKAIEELLRLSESTLDRAVVETLCSQISTLRNFVKHISTKESTVRKTEEEDYGLVLRYAPYHNIAKKRVSGYRVKLLLNDPYYGLMNGEAFLPIAEHTGQIMKLEKLAFEKMCIALEQLFEITEQKPRFVFDLSVQNFNRKTFTKEYISLLRRYGLEPERITLAFRESELFHSELPWREGFEELRNAGIGIMIDDFGGASSLISSLDSLQIQMLGLKREYTQRLTGDPKTGAVVSGLSKMARGLYVGMIAPAVTNARQEAECLHMEVKYAMGELYGAPLTFRELKKAYTVALPNSGGEDQ